MMMQNSLGRFFAAFIILFNIISFAEAEPFGNIPADSHTGYITGLVQDENGNIISAGEDGFITVWNIEENAAESRFQLSSYPIVSIAQRPNHSQIAIVESDGMGLFRISAWDYIQNKKLFTLRFKDPVSHVTYSKNGSFLIAGRTGRTGIVFINPENGDLLQSPPDLNGNIAFAATGKSERTMITYISSGVISYWNLESGEQMQQATVPQNMKSPILFNNNLFFAGIDKNGLVILDALTGKELGRNNSVKDGQLLAVSEGSRDFVCMQKQNNSNRYVLFRMENSGSLRRITQKTLPGNNLIITSSMLFENQIVLGTEDGKINLYQQQNNRIRELQFSHQFKIDEIAASKNSLAILQNSHSKNTSSQHENRIAFFPADFNEISADMIITFTNNNFDEIVSSDIAYNNEDYFILWKSNDPSISPVLQNKTSSITTVKGLSERYALRTTSVLNNLILFLDTGGNISIYNIDTQTIEYQYSVPGALHASFIDEKNIIAARIAANGTPFLMLNTATEETVPLAYPAEIGTRVFKSKNGRLYAAVVIQNEDDATTRIINVDTSNPSASQSLVEYQGEDISFSTAECEGNLATTLGGDGATLFTPRDFKLFERSSGLPIQLINTDKYFISLDSSGSVIWHNPSSGEKEAELRVYDGKWYLQKKNGDMLEGLIQ
jgi:WD40 repeat protein